MPLLEVGEANMGRRKTSTVDDLIEITSLLPWWAGILLAAGSYLLFSLLASQPLSGAGASINVIAVASTVLRIVAPIIFIIGTVGSIVGRGRRKELLSRAITHGDSAVASMSWRDFELLLGEAFRRQGYRVTETGGGGADGGVDLLLERNGATTLVQCKHWKAYRVGVPVVRELYGLMAHRQVEAGIVVTSGGFTEEARQFAEGKPIILLDGSALSDMLSQPDDSPPSVGALNDQVNLSASDPACPRCGGAMIKRTARSGPTAGSSFWGCGSFPACRGTRALL